MAGSPAFSLFPPGSSPDGVRYSYRADVHNILVALPLEELKPSLE